MAGTPSTGRVIRDVDPAALNDLVRRPRRATVTFVRDGEAEVVPVRTQLEGDRHLFGVLADSDALDGREVVLVIDDGPYWFQLRGLSVRGKAMRVATPGGDAHTLAWYAIDPRRVLAWDYASLREE